MSHAAIRLLNFNMTCLQEMSTAWTWSLRSIRSLQILAEKWAVNENLHAQSDQKPTVPAPAAMTTTDMDVEGFGGFNDLGPEMGTDPLDAFASTILDAGPENIDWLLAFDGRESDPQMDYAFFAQDLWGMGPS